MIRHTAFFCACYIFLYLLLFGSWCGGYSSLFGLFLKIFRYMD